jgi:hypothetical protein
MVGNIFVVVGIVLLQRHMRYATVDVLSDYLVLEHSTI